MEYVHHPVNAFHLLQRITTWIPKLKKLYPTLNFAFSMPALSDANIGASNGIADLQELYDIPTIDIIKGQITNYISRKTYLARSNLTSHEALKIATLAKTSNYFDGYISWCEGALQAARAESKDNKYIKHIR